MSCVNTIVPDHFKVFLRDVFNESFDKLKNRDGFFDIFIIFVTIVVKGHHFTIVFIYTRSCDNWSSKISADVFNDIFRITFLRFGIHIETVFVITIASRFYFFERRIVNSLFKFIKKNGTKC